jgi:hypothetical protein
MCLPLLAYFSIGMVSGAVGYFGTDLLIKLAEKLKK